MSLSTKELRRELKRQCKVHLIPYLNKNGFSQAAVIVDQPETKPSGIFPFGKQERIKSGNLEVIQIQFDKYGRPAMRIAFGKVPVSGIITPCGESIDMNDAILTCLPVFYELYSSRFTRRWFKLSLLEPKTEHSLERLVRYILELSNELLVWFETENIGKHVHVVDQR